MPVNSPVENVPRPNREHRPFKKPVDPFDGKLYQPIKLSEKVFIPIKDYPKVRGCYYYYFSLCVMTYIQWNPALRPPR